jgi:aminobenzoyl-glutamate transport protein
VANFAAFPPLGLVIVVIIGIGVTERSGLIAVALKRLVSAVPRVAADGDAGVRRHHEQHGGGRGLRRAHAAGRDALRRRRPPPAGRPRGRVRRRVRRLQREPADHSLDPLLAGLSRRRAQLVDPNYEVQPRRTTTS